MNKISETIRFKEWQKTIASSVKTKPITKADKLLACLIRTAKPRYVDTQPKTEKEFAEEHMRGELNEK